MGLNGAPPLLSSAPLPHEGRSCVRDGALPNALRLDDRRRSTTVLTPEQRRRTAAELAANLAAAGLDVQEVATELGLTAERVRSTLDVDGADPVDVWQLRDHLEHAAGDRAVPYSVLTETAGTAARGWFPLRTRR